MGTKYKGYGTRVGPENRTRFGSFAVIFFRGPNAITSITFDKSQKELPETIGIRTQ